MFDVLCIVEADAGPLTSRFCEVPTFRVALHCGPVVTAEIGLERGKIAYFGDTLNTTGRLEGLAKERGAEIVVSGDLLDRLGALPGHIRISGFGVRALRARRVSLRIAAVHVLKSEKTAS